MESEKLNKPTKFFYQIIFSRSPDSNGTIVKTFCDRYLRKLSYRNAYNKRLYPQLLLP